jgi:hypothetical protein
MPPFEKLMYQFEWQYANETEWHRYVSRFSTYNWAFWRASRHQSLLRSVGLHIRIRVIELPNTVIL